MIFLLLLLFVSCEMLKLVHYYYFFSKIIPLEIFDFCCTFISFQNIHHVAFVRLMSSTNRWFFVCSYLNEEEEKERDFFL